MAASYSFSYFLLSLCKNTLGGYFKAILNWNHHYEEEVSCDTSLEEDNISVVDHMNQYWHHYHIYIGFPSIFCGFHLQVGCK